VKREPKRRADAAIHVHTHRDRTIAFRARGFTGTRHENPKYSASKPFVIFALDVSGAGLSTEIQFYLDPDSIDVAIEELRKAKEQALAGPQGCGPCGLCQTVVK
jgi:hypothetical protein